jgi:hypothetical protein
MSGAGTFVGLCAAAIPVWWFGLFRSGAWRQGFVPDAAWPGFQAVLPADLTLAAVTAIVAIQILRDRTSVALLAATIGGWAYATVYSIAWASSVRAPVIGPALMIAAFIGLVLVWYAVVPSGRTGRR